MAPGDICTSLPPLRYVSGLWPIHLDIFEEHEFAPSATTDTALSNADQINENSEQAHISSTSDKNELPENENRMSSLEPTPSIQFENNVVGNSSEAPSAAVLQSQANANFQLENRSRPEFSQEERGASSRVTLWDISLAPVASHQRRTAGKDVPNQLLV